MCSAPRGTLLDPHPLNTLLWWCNLIVRVAGWIVPSERRPEWRREWESEIWHWCHFLAESSRLTVHTEQELIRHCWRAFPDALWRRFNHAVVLRLTDEIPRAPQFCLVGCLALLALLLFGRPTAFYHDLIAPAPYRDPGHLLTVCLSDESHWLQPEVLRNAAARWSRQSRLIDSSAAYAWRPAMVRGDRGTESIASARVTPGLFEFLGVAPSLGRVFRESDSTECEECVVLSNALWRSQFRRDPNVIGRSFLLNSTTVRVVGVMPVDFRLPFRDIAVFSLFDANPQAKLTPFEWPVALLRTRPGVESRAAKQQLQDLIKRTGEWPSGSQFDILSLSDIETHSLKSWAALFLLALAPLLVIKSAQFLRLRTTGPRAGVRDDFRWYLFFGVKTALLLVAALIVSFELSHLVLGTSTANAYQLASVAAIWFFALGAHLALTWSIRDQLGRCRVCLRGLGVRVNLASAGRILIDLAGDELVCDEGHGVLHVPVMESGSVDCERWTYLDESWQVLLGRRETRIQLS